VPVTMRVPRLMWAQLLEGRCLVLAVVDGHSPKALMECPVLHGASEVIGTRDTILI
jgi:hypothetical protein